MSNYYKNLCSETKQSYAASSNTSLFCQSYSKILQTNLSQIQQLKLNSPNYQRKDPITHNGVVQENQIPYRPSKKNSCNNYTDHISGPEFTEKTSKKRTNIQSSQQKQTQNDSWKPSTKQFSRNDKNILQQLPVENNKQAFSSDLNNRKDPILQNHVNLKQQKYSNQCAGDQVISDQCKQLADAKHLLAFERDSHKPVLNTKNRSQIFFEQTQNDVENEKKSKKKYSEIDNNMKNVLYHETKILKNHQLKDSSSKVTNQLVRPSSVNDQQGQDYRRRGQMLQREEIYYNNLVKQKATQNNE